MRSIIELGTPLERSRLGTAVWIFAAACLLSPAMASAQPTFRRGDVTDDGRVTMQDVCALTNFLFMGGSIGCLDAADINDDGVLSTTDSISLLNYLCVPGTLAPPAPGPIVCGVDPTPDGLTLCVYTSCAVPTPQPNSRFIRGDCDLSLSVTIADAIFSLSILFGLSGQNQCVSACDSNADAMFNLADPLYTLSFLFGSGSPPPAPFPNCGCDSACPAILDCASGVCP